MKIEFSRNNEQEKGFKELLGRFDEAERGAFKNLRGSHSHLSQKSLYT